MLDGIRADAGVFVELVQDGEVDMANSSESNLESLNLEIPLEPEFNLILHYFALFGFIGVSFGIFVLINSYGYDDVMFCLVIIIAPIIIASVVSRYLGEQFVRGVMTPIIITVPLSIISYFNEAANSCFCPFWCTCPPPPSYYHLPRLSAFIGAIIFLIYSISLQINGMKTRGFGIFTGLLISTLVFLFATLVGFWGFD